MKQGANERCWRGWQAWRHRAVNLHRQATLEPLFTLEDILGEEYLMKDLAAALGRLRLGTHSAREFLSC